MSYFRDHMASTIQQLTSMNYISVLSHIRRVCTPLDRVGRVKVSFFSQKDNLGSARVLDSSIAMHEYYVSLFDPYKQSMHENVTHYGYLCPVETPEGPACGLIVLFSFYPGR